MGFSALGCYGSEIATPNLDRLAASGIRFTQFYNTGRCCPTRASLLTGLYSHQAGIGHIRAHFSQAGFEETFLEHFSQAFARFFMRVGLPSTIPEFR